MKKKTAWLLGTGIVAGLAVIGTMTINLVDTFFVAHVPTVHVIPIDEILG